MQAIHLCISAMHAGLQPSMQLQTRGVSTGHIALTGNDNRLACAQGFHGIVCDCQRQGVCSEGIEALGNLVLADHLSRCDVFPQECLEYSVGAMGVACGTVNNDLQ